MSCGPFNARIEDWQQIGFYQFRQPQQVMGLVELRAIRASSVVTVLCNSALYVRRTYQRVEI